ncbi:MAG TPA: protein kinase, partial [Acidimicrobiales bacterium]|nr:protein kinase [Acidimicrobiales bacterium]
MPPSVLAGRYELRTRIGSGGMAAVWGAYDRRLGRDVAVKILSESLADDERYRTRLEREARHIASLAHPNIVVVHDVGVEDNQPFIVMELVKGKSLRQLLSESSPLQPEKVAALASDVLAGLGHAHEAGILHRDIKPGNILVTDSGVSKLADFGIAKATEETVDLTDSGAILGTVSYASPEQLSGNVLGPPSDLYSLGGVLYECLAGHPPFVADNIAALVSQQQFARPEPLQSVSSGSPDELRMAIMRALEKDPARRFASAAEMKRGLGSAVGYGSEGRHPVSIRGALPRARTATVTVLFCDVVGSTALQSDIGDDAADGIRRRLFDVLRSVVETHNGNMVKTMGDGVMAVFTESTVDALRCAIEMTRMAPTVTDGLAVRVGLSHGEVTSEGGDWFGTPVVEAARLESASEPGTVLAAEVVRTIVGSRGGFIFDELPPIALKGFQNPVRAVRVCNAKAVSLPEKLSGLTARFPRETLKPHTLRSRRLIACGTAITLVVLAAVLVPVLVNGTPAGHLSSASLIGTEAGYTPRYVSVRCPSSTGGTRVTCGQLIVPQDRSHPKGLQVHLLVVRAGALTSQPASDPVVDLGDVSLGAEGPSSETRLYSTYISLSRRGGYGSIPELNCPEEETAQEASLALPLGSAVALSEQENAFTTCRTRLIGAHVDPNAYGNDAAAADYRDLLRVLHIERANLLVGSNGSLLAFALMRQYPELVRSVT